MGSVQSVCQLLRLCNARKRNAAQPQYNYTMAWPLRARPRIAAGRSARATRLAPHIFHDVKEPEARWRRKSFAAHCFSPHFFVLGFVFHVRPPFSSSLFAIPISLFALSYSPNPMRGG